MPGSDATKMLVRGGSHDIDMEQQVRLTAKRFGLEFYSCVEQGCQTIHGRSVAATFSLEEHYCVSSIRNRDTTV